MSEEKNWQEDPSLKGVSNEKMKYMSDMLSQVQGKDANAMLPFLMGLANKTDNNGMDFDDKETDLILQVLQQRMAPEERSRIDMLRNMSHMISRSGRTKK